MTFFFAQSDDPRLEGHTADLAIAGCVTNDLRMHRARVFDLLLRRGRPRLCCYLLPRSKYHVVSLTTRLLRNPRLVDCLPTAKPMFPAFLDRIAASASNHTCTAD